MLQLANTNIANTNIGTSRVGSRTGPLIVGIGGTMRPGSATEQAVRAALSAAEQAGARTHLLGATALQLPLYLPGETRRTTAARQLVNAIRIADGIVIGSPAYHGGISGLVKNALDYLEDLREAPRPYLHGRAVGCLVTARGSQAATTLTSLRAVVHALQGWPTPLGVAVNTENVTFAPDGTSTDAHISSQLSLMGEQVVEFALSRAIAA